MEISLGLQIFGTVPFFKSLISAFNFYWTHLCLSFSLAFCSHVGSFASWLFSLASRCPSVSDSLISPLCINMSLLDRLLYFPVPLCQFSAFPGFMSKCVCCLLFGAFLSPFWTCLPFVASVDFNYQVLIKLAFCFTLWFGLYLSPPLNGNLEYLSIKENFMQMKAW